MSEEISKEEIAAMLAAIHDDEEEKQLDDMMQTLKDCGYITEDGEPVGCEEMSIKQAIREIEYAIESSKRDGDRYVAVTVDTMEIVLAALSVEQDYKDFAEYVEMLIFEYECDSGMDIGVFSELACRKLAKLGIVKANGDEWERVKE